MKFVSSKYIFVFLFTMGNILFLIGQPRFINSKLVSVGQGIEGLIVNHLYIDNDKKVWIKTDDALNVYDGYDVQVLIKGDQTYNLHSSENLIGIVDKGSYIDIYYQNEHSFFDRWDKETHCVDLVPFQHNALHDTTLLTTLSMSNELWAIKKNSTEYYLLNTHTNASITSKYLQLNTNIEIQKIHAVKDGFWFLDTDFNVFFLSSSNLENQNYLSPPKDLIPFERKTKQINNVLQLDSVGGLWVSYPGIKGMYHKAKADSLLTKADNLPDNGLYVFMWQDQKGRALFGLSRRQRFIDEFYLKDRDHQIIHWKEFNDFSNIPTVIYSHDFYDYLFLGSFRELQILEFSKPFINIYNDKKLARPHGKYGNIIRGGIEVNDGSIFIMKDNGWHKQINNNIQKVEFGKGEFEYVIAKYNNGTNTIFALRKEIIIPQNSHRYEASPELISINPETNDYKYIEIGNPIQAFSIASQNRLVLVSFDSLDNYQVSLYHVNTGELHNIGVVINKNKVTNVESLVYDEKNNQIFILDGSNGLFIIDLSNNSFTPTLLDFEHQKIRYIGLTLGVKDNLWISTTKGAILFNTKEKKTIRSISKKDGLINDHICSVIPRDNLVWISTFFGLYSYNLADSNLITITEKRGIPSNEFNEDAFSERQNGQLFFGSANGLIGINTQTFKSFGNDFRIYLRRIILKERNKTRTLNSIPNETLKISHKKHQELSISLGNSLLGNYNETTYSYFMAGVDKEWKELRNEHTIKYNRLPIGNFTLYIKGISSIGIQSINKVAINLKVTAPFYDKPPFRVGLSSALIGLLIFFLTTKYYKTRVVRENQKLQYEKRISQLELFALQSQMNPHFIFNAINSIQECLWENDKEFVEKHLNHFAKLTRLYLESSKVKLISLEQEIELLKLYTALEKLRFKDKLDVNIEINPELEPRYFKIPTMLVQPFVENAINHGLFHKQGNGKVNITISERNDHVLIVVEDDGIGRIAAKRIKEKSFNNYKSRALQITEERIEVLKIHENITIDIDVKDLYNDEGNSIGTRVEILIPEMF